MVALIDSASLVLAAGVFTGGSRVSWTRPDLVKQPVLCPAAVACRRSPAVVPAVLGPTGDEWGPGDRRLPRDTGGHLVIWRVRRAADRSVAASEGLSRALA